MPPHCLTQPGAGHEEEPLMSDAEHTLTPKQRERFENYIKRDSLGMLALDRRGKQVRLRPVLDAPKPQAASAPSVL